MEEVIIYDKEKYLKENYPFGGASAPELTSEIVCLHCNNVFKVGQYKVFKDEDDEEYICCPNTPNCNGTVIDWIPLG